MRGWSITHHITLHWCQDRSSNKAYSGSVNLWDVRRAGEAIEIERETIVHLLQDVARTRLCCVDVDFGSERVSGILDTGAQGSLLNTSSYERVKSMVPPLHQPRPGARGFVGVSRKRLTVHG